MSWEVRLRKERQGTKIEGTKQERGLPVEMGHSEEPGSITGVKRGRKMIRVKAGLRWAGGRWVHRDGVLAPHT